MRARATQSAALAFWLAAAAAGCGGPTKPPATVPPPPEPASAPAPQSPAPAPGAPAVPAPGPGTPPDSSAYPPAWRPPETGPGPDAKRVLDTLPEPVAVALPRDLPRRASAPSTPRECFAVQLAVISDAAGAGRTARDAESRLSAPARSVPAAGAHRVWAGNCLTREAAEALRDRARATGYPEAFVVSEGTKP